MKMEQHYWVAWAQIKGVGPSRLKKIWQHFGSMERAWFAAPQDLGAVEGLGDKLIQQIVAGRSPLNPAQLYEQHLEKNPQFWTPIDPAYPQLLREIPSPPPLLYYRGQVEPLENQGKIPAIAIVGTRYPSDHGRRWTEHISKVLAQGGFTIVSGLAQGVDGIAHSTCLQTKGRTIAVLGTGVDQVYPANHRPLYNEIAEMGLIVSEYPAGTRPDRSHFPARNRIIAGLTRATLVMEAPSRSGSLITAHYGLEFNREVYALPNSPEQVEAAGCLDLIRRGAGMILGATQLIEELGGLPQLDTVSPQLTLPLTSAEPAPAPTVTYDQIPQELLPLWQAIAPEPTAFDLIVVQSGMGADQVSATLLQWELMGLITQLPGMRYRRL
ncbi:DNA-protecting protein DprA [Synechococcus moorigangaii CMS01]|nr:DNA-protecting protein DprA [Synechococcus moorigangaii CMS01]